MTAKDMDDHELLVRIDERVKQLCESTDSLREDIGKQDERIAQNRSRINRNKDRVNWNRRILIGVMITVIGGIIVAFLTMPL